MMIATRTNSIGWHVRTRSLASMLAMAALGLLALPRAASAQVVPDSVHLRNDCRLAAQVLTHGQPAVHRAWALRRIRACGRLGAEILASLIDTSRRQHDYTASLDTLINAARRIIDPVLFEMALDITTDGAAGKSARVQAIRLLYSQLEPGSLDPYESFLPGQIKLYVPPIDHGLTRDALPPDALNRAEAALSRIIAAPGTPEAVLAAADKVRGILLVKLECPRGVSDEVCLERLRILEGGQ